MRAGWEFIHSAGAELDEILLHAPLEKRLFSEWIEGECAARGLRRNEVVRSSHLNQTFAYQIIMGTRHASRDKLIQLAFGMGLDIDGSCELLERGGANALMPSCLRDVVIAFALERGLGVLECDDLLWSFGERTLVSRGADGEI